MKHVVIKEGELLLHLTPWAIAWVPFLFTPFVLVSRSRTLEYPNLEILTFGLMVVVPALICFADTFLLPKTTAQLNSLRTWCWITPLYLFQRAWVTQTAKLAPLVWIVMAIVSMNIKIEHTSLWVLIYTMGVPSCGSADLREITIAAFNKNILIREKGVEALRIERYREIYAGHDAGGHPHRICEIAVKSIDGHTWGAFSSFGIGRNGLVILEMNVIPNARI